MRLIPQYGGTWRSDDDAYEVTRRLGADDDYKIVHLATPNRWSTASTLTEAVARINGHRASNGRNWNPTH